MFAVHKYHCYFGCWSFRLELFFKASSSVLSRLLSSLFIDAKVIRMVMVKFCQLYLMSLVTTSSRNYQNKAVCRPEETKRATCNTELDATQSSSCATFVASLWLTTSMVHCDLPPPWFSVERRPALPSGRVSNQVLRACVGPNSGCRALCCSLYFNIIFIVE